MEGSGGGPGYYLKLWCSWRLGAEEVAWLMVPMMYGLCGGQMSHMRGGMIKSTQYELVCIIGIGTGIHYLLYSVCLHTDQ